MVEGLGSRMLGSGFRVQTAVLESLIRLVTHPATCRWMTTVRLKVTALHQPGWTDVS